MNGGVNWQALITAIVGAGSVWGALTAWQRTHSDRQVEDRKDQRDAWKILNEYVMEENRALKEDNERLRKVTGEQAALLQRFDRLTDEATATLLTQSARSAALSLPRSEGPEG